MSSVSLVVPDVLCLFTCITVQESVSFSLLSVSFAWVCFSLVCMTGFETLLCNTCLLLGYRSVLQSAESKSLPLVMTSVALWVPWGGCWISFKRGDCNFLCFLPFSENLFCDLLCLRWCFEVFRPKPWRRQLQIDVFMHCSFFGKL